MADKSIIVTYLLWITAGWFGVHHLYLRRDRHAFVWLWTLGGCCGIGWLMEICRLHHYVDLANGCGEETKRQITLLRRRLSPEFDWKRFAGELIFSMLTGFLAASAIPEELRLNWRIVAALSCFFVATGVHTVANIGVEQCPFGVCVLGAFAPLPCYLLASSDSLPSVLTYSSITASVACNWLGKNYKPLESLTGDSYRHVCCRLLVLTLACTAMLAMMTSAIYFNCHVTTRDGQRVRVKDALHNVISSPIWAAKRRTLKLLFYRLTDDGPHDFWWELNVLLDPEGEESAYRTLNLTSSASQKEITERYRQLVKLYHPDKVQAADSLEHEQAEQRFIHIEQTYNKLSNIRQRRTENSHRNEL